MVSQKKNNNLWETVGVERQKGRLSNERFSVPPGEINTWPDGCITSWEGLENFLST